MRYSFLHRSTRSASPLTSWDLAEERNFSEHVNNIINRSRANSEMRQLGSSGVRDLHYSSLVSDSTSPWSKTGAFYWPRYPEGWRGTAACTSPLRREYNYWASPARYYRYKSYYPRYYPRYWASPARYYRYKSYY